MTALGALAIALTASLAAAMFRHMEATERAQARCHAVLRAATSLEAGRIDSAGLFDELHRAYWLGRPPRLTGLQATLYARTAGVRS